MSRDLRRRLDPIEVRHRDVQHRNIRRIASQRSDGGPAVASLARHREIRLAF
jgi:hypothetical protein